jgi:TRAP-type transport system small permease protein
LPGVKGLEVMLKSLLDWLCRVVMLVIMLSMAAIVGSISAQVFWRYVLNDSLVWPEEVSRYVFIWACCLGMSVGVRRGDLIAIDVLWVGRPKRVRLIVAIVARLLAVPLLVVFIWQGWVLMEVVVGQLTASTRVPVGWVYLALPVSCILALLFLLEVLASDIGELLSFKEVPR